MFSKTLRYLERLLFPFLIFLTVFFIAYKNYQSGTYLLGWDSLHPEFDFRLAFQRAFSGVWREDQGVGDLFTHSHMADLPRIFILWLESFFFPQNFLRYSFVFLCLFLGPLGFYFAFKFIFEENNKLATNFSAFLASLFYLLNLITLQHFYVPFEMFCVQFGFLPWIFLFLMKFLRSGDKHSLFWFSIFTFFASSMAYASALYLAFLVCFVAFLGVYFVLSRNFITFKKVFLVLFLQIALNAYWLLPNLYSILNASSVIIDSKINQLFSPEVFLRNQDYGSWQDVVLGKNFLFDWRAFDFENNTFVDLMASWNSHLNSPYLKELGFLLFVICVIGIFFSFFAKKKELWSFISILLISLFFLQNINGPLGRIYGILVDRYDVFREGFRMPFTKFSILYQFSLSFYFGVFFYYLFSLFGRFRIRFLVYSLLSALVFFALVYRCWPFFNGELISSIVRRDLPSEYFELFDYMRNYDGRIAVFPVYSLWGWEYHEWKYEGSGFLGFGIERPILIRDYDRWSPYNESFYNEASSTLYKYHLIDLDRVRPCQDKKDCKREEELKEGIEKWNKEVVSEFEKVLEKYNVSYLLLDESVVNAGGDGKILYFKQIKDLFDKSSRIEKVAQFGFLTVYHFSSWTGSDPVQTPGNFFSINSDLKYSKYDYIYQNYGEYVSGDDGLSTPAFPFVNFDPRASVSFRILDDGERESLVVENKDYLAKVVLPVVEKIEEKFGEEQGFKEGYNCDLKKKGIAVKKRLDKGNFYGAYDGGVSCDWFYYPTLDRSRAWLMRIKGKNLAGRSLKVYLQNLRTGRMDLEELLKADKNGDFDSYFVIYPSESKEVYEFTKSYENIPEGYTLNIETRSFGKIMSENIIEDITFIPIDIDWFYQLTTFKGGSLKGEQNNLEVLSVKKYGTWGYKVQVGFDGRSLNNARYEILVLPQGFDKGWVALEIPSSKLEIRGYKLLKHLKVNSWANGWLIPAGDSKSGEGSFKVFVFFWPQALQWIGFLVGGISVLLLMRGGKPKLKS